MEISIQLKRENRIAIRVKIRADNSYGDIAIRILSRGYDLSVVDSDEADAQRACMKLGVSMLTRIFNVHVPNDALEFFGDPDLVGGYRGARARGFSVVLRLRPLIVVAAWVEGSLSY